MKTKSVGSLVAELAESGITLIPDGEKLKILGADDAVGSAMGIIKEMKNEILIYLSETRKTPSYEDGWEKVFPIQGGPFWRKDGLEIPI